MRKPKIKLNPSLSQNPLIDCHKNIVQATQPSVKFCADSFGIFLPILANLHNYLRQVNEVNGGDNVFVRCVCACVCVCVCVRSGWSWELNANSSKTVKATDFKFDISLPMDSPDMTPKNFSKRGRGQGHVTP